MSASKRSHESDPSKSPTSNITASAKKRCITDFFRPTPKSIPIELATPLSSAQTTKPIISPNIKEELARSPEPTISKSAVTTPVTSRVTEGRSPLTPSIFTPNLSTLRLSTPRQSASRPMNASPISIRSAVKANNNTGGTDDENHLHKSFKFLYPPERRDINMRKPDDPDYDEKTLHVPQSFLLQQTPALRQWWLIKQRNMDSILFFKMGKFYELFNEDAVIGVNNLDINYMKGDETRPAHAGFPEVSYEKYAKMLIEKGLKVLRIEQTETPAMMEERCQRTGKKGKFDKVVAREVCRVTTKGTQMLGVLETVFHSANNQYLLAIYESDNESTCGGRIFGICFVDVTISKLYIGQFEDDHNYSLLNILLSHYKPTEILYERNNINKETYQILLRTGALLSPLKGEKEFWPIKKALNHLRNKNIFIDHSGTFAWPRLLVNLFDGDSSENISSFEPKPEFIFGLYAFGALVYYLDAQLIADQVLRCANFNIYRPPVHFNGPDNPDSSCNQTKPTMVLDHIALKNLEVFENSEGGNEATLNDSINFCKTHFGQRLLMNWLCRPLCDIAQINNRLDVIDALISNNNASLMNELVHILSSTPDLERLLTKVKSQCFKSESDSRAIMFDGQQHSKAKITSFLNLLQNLKRLRKFIGSLERTSQRLETPYLKKLLSFTDEGGFYPNYASELDYFDKAFDHDEARKTGRIIPAPGVDVKYDKYSHEINRVTDELDQYLEQQKKVLKCRHLEYFGTAKNRFQIQVPDNYVDNVPDNYRIETTRKGFKRYYTSEIDELFEQLTLNEDHLKKTLDNIMSTIFAQFSNKMMLWTAAIECIAQLDVFQSIANFVRSLIARGIDVCRPELSSSDEPMIEYSDGRHPSLVKNNPNFTPNDLKLDKKLILLTGANMGGKSTIMRQTALMTILAQIGCYVTAKRMILTPVDRIFSRLGASDRLLEGESTFYTELVETSAMLRHATKDSLLLLDELGRGTSTYDGTAIAYAVTQEIVGRLNCRCLFSTHYHSLVRDFADNPQVRLAHMRCKIEKNAENDDDGDVEPLKESITFLYKITDGPVSRSYGFNVAKLAKIPDSIISLAYKKSKELELSCKILERLQQICSVDGTDKVSDRNALKLRVLNQLTEC